MNKFQNRFLISGIILGIVFSVWSIIRSTRFDLVGSIASIISNVLIWGFLLFLLGYIVESIINKSIGKLSKLLLIIGLIFGTIFYTISTLEGGGFNIGELIFSWLFWGFPAFTIGFFIDNRVYWKKALLWALAGLIFGTATGIILDRGQAIGFAMIFLGLFGPFIGAFIKIYLEKEKE